MRPKGVTMNTNQLLDKLTKANDAYRNGNPIMSDAQFDALEDQLKAIDPNHPWFSKVGATPVSGWMKARHSRPMASLNKAQDASELHAWASSCSFRDGELLVVMDKLDGASLNCEYVDGKFSRAITRGDGDIGEDITANAKKMPFPKVIPNKFTGSLRGEVIVRYGNFKTHFIGQSNPRNTANGTMKRQSDSSGCQYLDVVMFDVMPDHGEPLHKADQFGMLKQWGFSIPRYQVVNSIKDVETVYDEYINTHRSSVEDHVEGDGKLDYDIDGLVIQFDHRQRFSGLGDQGRGPKGAVAFKFPHEEKVTTLRNVRWQVGNSGRITPVAEFDEVVLAGAKVVQASLHNISNMQRLADDVGAIDMGIGDQIMVARRNDVIPYVEAIVSSGTGVGFEVPSECPCCSAKTERDGEYLVCRNDDCEAQISGAIKRWIKKLGVLHFGEALIEALVDAEMVEDPADLYTLDPAEVANLTMGQRRVGSTADKALTNLHKNTELELHVLVGSLGIPMIGRSMAQTIVDAGYDSLEKMLQATVKDIASISGVGMTKANHFVKGYYEKLWLVSKLLGAGVRIKRKVTGRFTGMTACVTGFRGKEEQDIVAAFTGEGGVMKSGVSGKLTYLICKDAKSNSGKPSKARSLNASGKANIEVFDIDGFWTNVMGSARP